MSRERTLTIAGGFVALGMAGLLSLTALNGRWLDVPSHYTQGDVGVQQLEVELRALVLRQARYRERQRRYTTDLAELNFDPGRVADDGRVAKLREARSHVYRPRDPRISVTIQAADREGWTGIATSREAGIGCVMRVGYGPAATVNVDSVLENVDWNLERLETCEVSDLPAPAASILETQTDQH